MSTGTKTTAQGRTGEWRFFGILRQSPAFHFYLLQSIGFLYLAWRFASRNYTVYGILPDEAFDYPRAYLNELWPLPPLHFTTFQFIYDFLPRPTAAGIHAMEATVVGASLLGFLGIFPRLCAVVAFLLAAHVTGMGQASNMDVDGGTLILSLMLILALSPSRAFYGWRQGFRPLKQSVDHHWPVFLLFLVAGSYYSFSGINKLVEIGLSWPVTVHLDHLAEVGVEQAMFRSDRFRIPAISAAHTDYAMSVVGGFGALIGEMGFLLVLFLPRYRIFFAWSMIVLHFLVFAMQGINFLGSSAILALCVDWNALVRRGTMIYDGDCGVCQRTVDFVRRLDWFGRLDARASFEAGGLPVDESRLVREMAFIDENGDVSYGADAFGEFSTRCPLLWPLAILYRIPGVVFVARVVYRAFAKHRHATVPGASCGIDGPR